MFYGIITFFDTTLTALATGTKTPEQRWFNHSLKLRTYWVWSFCHHTVTSLRVAVPPSPPPPPPRRNKRERTSKPDMSRVLRRHSNVTQIYAKICNLIIMWIFWYRKLVGCFVYWNSLTEVLNKPSIFIVHFPIRRLPNNTISQKKNFVI